MKLTRTLMVALAALTLLGGCMVHGHGGGVAVVGPVVPAPVVVAHVHGPNCGHFYGYWSGYPIYYYDNYYTYWDGGAWLRLPSPPAIYYGYSYRPTYRSHTYYRPHGHSYRSYPAPRVYSPSPRVHGARPAK